MKSWFITYVFVLYKLFYTHNRSKDTGHFKQNLLIFFENVHTVREEEASWSGRFPCAFFQSLPSGIPLPQPIIMMQYTLYVADSLAANETHTLWFLIFVKSTGGSVAVYVVDS